MGVNSFRDRNSLLMKGPSQEKGQQFSLIPQVPLGPSTGHGSVRGTGQACPQGSTLQESPVLPGWGWFGACLADLRSLARDKSVQALSRGGWALAEGLELHTVTKETEQGESVTGK